MMKMKVEAAQPEDAKRIAEVYNASFYSDYIKYGECPGYNKTEANILAGMKHKSVFKIIADNKIVGAISVTEKQDKQFHLSALCIVPDYANKGIGQEAMRVLDQKFADAKLWTLETPTDKLENHYFYKKFGYRVTKEYMVGTVPISYFERPLQV